MNSEGAPIGVYGGGVDYIGSPFSIWIARAHTKYLTSSYPANMPGKVTTTVLALSAVLASMQVAAIPTYVAKIPNGANVDGVQALGHVNPEGGGARNAFGTAFGTAGHAWTKELCEADSDGDGQTNGQELGDPCCAWVESSNEVVQWSKGLSHPGLASSKSDPSLWASVSCGSASNSTGSSTSNSTTTTTTTTTTTPTTTTATPSTTTATPAATTAAPSSAAASTSAFTLVSATAVIAAAVFAHFTAPPTTVRDAVPITAIFLLTAFCNATPNAAMQIAESKSLGSFRATGDTALFSLLHVLDKDHRLASFYHNLTFDSMHHLLVDGGIKLEGLGRIKLCGSGVMRTGNDALGGMLIGGGFGSPFHDCRADLVPESTISSHDSRRNESTTGDSSDTVPSSCLMKGTPPAAWPVREEALPLTRNFMSGDIYEGSKDAEGSSFIMSGASASFWENKPTKFVKLKSSGSAESLRDTEDPRGVSAASNIIALSKSTSSSKSADPGKFSNSLMLVIEALVAEAAGVGISTAAASLVLFFSGTSETRTLKPIAP
ncbi:hypothetical protein FI667_g7373, partial [Globisporangium splendens]